MVDVLGGVNPEPEEAVPAYEPPANPSLLRPNPSIIEKAKGMARELGATDG